jgi:hypothetical protein
MTFRHLFDECFFRALISKGYANIGSAGFCEKRRAIAGKNCRPRETLGRNCRVAGAETGPGAFTAAESTMLYRRGTKHEIVAACTPHPLPPWSIS